ncbi:MAG: hypothetical protein QME94_17650 [Anaerolineae bacterium]|nr:hypothetical protein [Anaerolineae bacterium]
MGRTPINRDGRVQNVEITEITEEPTPLIPLSRTGHQPENPALDVRGYLMYGSDGQVMGRVDEILLDADRLTEDRGLPLYHMEYAVVRFTQAAGTQQWILVPMAAIKEVNPRKRRVVVRGPARLACQEALSFRAPDELTPEHEQEIYAFWEVQPRWQRSGRSPRRLVEERR